MKRAESQVTTKEVENMAKVEEKKQNLELPPSLFAKSRDKENRKDKNK